jgi:hypothetical protein
MSTVFLSFGPTSGFLTGQCINNLVECADMPPTWYTPHSSALLPNVVFFDNAKSVRLYLDEKPPVDLPAGRRVERFEPSEDSPIRIPRYKPTPFVEYIKSGGATILPLDQPRPNFQLEKSDITWSDIVNFNLVRHCFYEIPGTDIEPLLTYSSGLECCTESAVYDEMTEPIRRCLERVDRVSCLVCSVDRNYGYGGVYTRMAEYLSEEAPKASQFTFSVAEDVSSDQIACNACLSLSSCLRYSSVHTVLTIPPALPSIIDAPSLNLYQRTSLLSMPVTSSLLPILRGTTTAREIVDIVAPSSALKFASLSSAFPFYEPMTDYSFKAEERIFSRYSCVNGVPTAAGQQMIGETLKPASPFFYGGSAQKNPLFVGLTMPHFFRSRVITNTGDRPTQRPAGLTDEEYQRLVLYKVIKVRPGVDCAQIRVLSTAAAFSTSRSLAEPLQNTADFFRNAPAITRTIDPADAQAAAEVVYNVIEGLTADQ